MNVHYDHYMNTIVNDIVCPVCAGVNSLERLRQMRIPISDYAVFGKSVRTFGDNLGRNNPSVLAICQCGHRWTLAGIDTLYELFLDFQEEEADNEEPGTDN